MARKTFQRISDNGYDTLDITESAVSDKNNIIAFKTANGVHYHLRKHLTSHHYLADAKTAALTGGTPGATFGSRQGPKGLLKGAAIGTVLFFLGELAYQKVSEHLQNAKHNETLKWVYVDERKNEVYWGPVSA